MILDDESHQSVNSSGDEMSVVDEELPEQEANIHHVEVHHPEDPAEVNDDLPDDVRNVRTSDLSSCTIYTNYNYDDFFPGILVSEISKKFFSF